MDAKKIHYPVQDRWSYLWLMAAVVLSLFASSSGKWLVPITTWLVGIFYIRFFRSQRRVGLAYLWVGLSMGIVAAITTPTALLGSMVVPIFLATAIIGALPYLADRLLAPHLPGFAATFAYPLARTTMEFVSAATSPFASSGVSVSSQYESLALLQVISLTGMWGLMILIQWFASLVNWAWEREFAWGQIRRGTLLYLGLLFLVVFYGQARLWFAPVPEQTVRVAGVSMVEWRTNLPAMNRVFPSDLEAFRQMMEERYQLYFDATIQEARAGAKMISWPESAATVAEEDAPALLARLAELAVQEGVYLVIPMVVMPTDDSPYANKLVVFDPQGQVVLEHFKYGGPGMEGNRINGDRVLRTAQTPYGVISAVICWDTLLQGVVTQAGRNSTDILFAPDLVFPGFDPIFFNAPLRAIENGISIIQVSDMGVSAVIDPYGRTLARTDFSASERVVVAQVPTKGVRTLYPYIGDLFGLLSSAGTVGLVVWGVLVSRRSRKRKQAL